MPIYTIWRIGRKCGLAVSGGMTGRASCSDEGSRGNRGRGTTVDGRRSTDGRHEALAEGTAHLRTHPHSIVVSIRGNGNGHGQGQAWVHRGYGHGTEGTRHLNCPPVPQSRVSFSLYHVCDPAQATQLAAWPELLSACTAHLLYESRCESARSEASST